MKNPIINKYGTKIWFNEKKELHREDGPAVIYSDGYKAWYQNGQLHRLDGPAIQWDNRYKEYWINGKKLSELEFITKFQNLNIQTEEIL